MPFEDDDDAKPRLPMIVYLVIGILAVIGLFSIIGTVMSGVYLVLRLAVALAVVALVLYALKAVFWGRADKVDRDRSNLS